MPDRKLTPDAATPVLAHVFPLIPWALVLVFPLGLSFGVALVSDLLSLLTLHLRLFHFATAALCGVSMTALVGLWDLFRGAFANSPLALWGSIGP